MADSLVDEFNEILKGLDDLSEDKIQAFVVRIAELFKKIHHNSEFGTEKQKKEALAFAAQIQPNFNKLQAKLAKNPTVDASQFKNLLTFLQDDITHLAERKSRSSIHTKAAQEKGSKKKKVIKKV